MSIQELGNGAMMVPPEGGDALWVLGHLCDIKVLAAQSGGAFSLMDARLAPSLMAAPPHRHAATDEAFYVLEGELDVQVGDQRLTATPETFLFVPRGTVHGFGNATREPARALVFHMPPGFEGFYREIGEPADTRTLPSPPTGPPDFGRMMAAAAQYGMEILPPPQRE